MPADLYSRISFHFARRERGAFCHWKTTFLIFVLCKKKSLAAFPAHTHIQTHQLAGVPISAE